MNKISSGGMILCASDKGCYAKYLLIANYQMHPEDFNH